MPWLRPYLAGLVRELTAALDLDPGSLFSGVPGLDDLRGLVDRVREDGLATVVLGPERRAQMDGVQAFMAVLEGYAEHVMDAVGADVIDDLPRLRAAMERRRADRTGLLRLFEKLIGMDMKLRQYEQGKRFCDGVVEQAGHRRPQPRLGGPEPAARRSPSSTIRPAGSRAPSPPPPDPTTRSDTVPPAGRSGRRPASATLSDQDERPFRMSQSSGPFSAVFTRKYPASCNKDWCAGYKHVFDGNTRSKLVLSSIAVSAHQRG